MSSAHSLLDRVLLHTAGLEERTRWQVNGRPGDTFEHFGLVAEPGAFAMSRTRGICVVQCLAGCVRALADEELAKVRLDAAVCVSVAPFGSDLQIRSRVLFEDDCLELFHSPQELGAAMRLAQRWVARQGLAVARTCDVARALSSRLS